MEKAVGRPRAEMPESDIEEFARLVNGGAGEEKIHPKTAARRFGWNYGSIRRMLKTRGWELGADFFCRRVESEATR